MRKIAYEHKCRGLSCCENHPRWHVFRDRFGLGWWAVDRDFTGRYFRTHAAAIAYAQRKARE